MQTLFEYNILKQLGDYIIITSMWIIVGIRNPHLYWICLCHIIYKWEICTYIHRYCNNCCNMYGCILLFHNVLKTYPLAIIFPSLPSIHPSDVQIYIILSLSYCRALMPVLHIEGGLRALAPLMLWKISKEGYSTKL